MTSCFTLLHTQQEQQMQIQILSHTKVGRGLYVSVSWVIIGSDNGLSSVQSQTIT